ncbi:MAG TPA: exonuclease domain-containing protein [Bacteroidales bacterium]|nr:exonuclease domain-containing protein [Bacteroidales bacterium]
MNQRFAIIDVETTGGSAGQDKITEIAIVVTDGEQIVEQFSSLVNPECMIPAYIVGLTGITNEMVENAPCFYQLARKIVELTENTIFVAHNAAFDYNFIRCEFLRLGYKFRREQLCTVKMSRKLIPGLPSYSLGNLCEKLGIVINNRHRAEGDAVATYHLFKLLYKIDREQYSGKNMQGFSTKGLNRNLDIATLKALPEAAGVYYFYNENTDLIYIGKSKNIYRRVITHLNNETTSKGVQLKSEIAGVSFELTGSELIALLKESCEIKRNKPRYNKAQRRTKHQWGLYYDVNENGYLQFSIRKNDDGYDVPLDSFVSQGAAKDNLFSLCNEYSLCQKHCGLYQSAGACFYHALGDCRGACIGEEPAESYNDRATQVLKRYGLENENIFIVTSGRNEEEIGVVSVKNGKYMGYGFCDIQHQNNPELLSDCIASYPDNRDARQIIRTYLKTNRDYRLISMQADVCS